MSRKQPIKAPDTKKPDPPPAPPTGRDERIYAMNCIPHGHKYSFDPDTNFNSHLLVCMVCAEVRSYK